VADVPEKATFEWTCDGVFVHAPVVNGHKVNFVTGLALDGVAGKHPTVTLRLLPVHALDVALSDALIVLDDETREALVSLGWTPPGEQPAPDLDTRATALAREHGSFSLHFDATQNDASPDYWPWTLARDGEGGGWRGLTASEALELAAAELAQQPGDDAMSCACGRRLPWPTQELDVTCPQCGTIWQDDGLDFHPGTGIPAGRKAIRIEGTGPARQPPPPGSVAELVDKVTALKRPVLHCHTTVWQLLGIATRTPGHLAAFTGDLTPLLGIQAYGHPGMPLGAWEACEDGRVVASGRLDLQWLDELRSGGFLRVLDTTGLSDEEAQRLADAATRGLAKRVRLAPAPRPALPPAGEQA
jgi:hypothetical protein